MPFVDECSICERSLGKNKKSEVITKCGHRFHRKCVDDHIESEDSYDCPDCGKTNGLKKLQQVSSPPPSSSEEEEEDKSHSSNENPKNNDSSMSETEVQNYFPSIGIRDSLDEENKKPHSSSEKSSDTDVCIHLTKISNTIIKIFLY